MKPKNKKKIVKKNRKRLSELIEKAGFNIESEKLKKIMFRLAIFINFLISSYLLYYFSIKAEVTLAYVLIAVFLLWTAGFFLLLVLLWIIFYMAADLSIYKRRVGIENVLPDFLQLTSANVRAGMPIDQALWHAIRPNFGVLAKEMEDVAKQTMSGTSLEEALCSFAAKYDSTILKRSVSLLIEGLNAGGEIGELLEKIALNIEDMRIMQKEMSASVTTYAIFIGFAAIVGAPFLLALSSQLLEIIEKIISTISIPKTSQMMISFSKVGVKPSEFRIFAMTTLTITSFLSAAIVATIKKGDVKAGIKYIPIFIFSSLMLFLIFSYLFGLFMKSIF